jgi:plastocyanin
MKRIGCLGLVVLSAVAFAVLVRTAADLRGEGQASAGQIVLVVSRLQGPPATDTAAIQVRASMGGFEPRSLTVKVGQAVKVEFASMDNSMHSDGGGWHQFAIDALRINWKVGPLSSEVFEFTAPAVAGTYSFYCDICCGGKENPSMQGKLTVTA